MDINKTNYILLRASILFIDSSGKSIDVPSGSILLVESLSEDFVYFKFKEATIKLSKETYCKYSDVKIIINDFQEKKRDHYTMWLECHLLWVQNLYFAVLHIVYLKLVPGFYQGLLF